MILSKVLAIIVNSLEVAASAVHPNNERWRNIMSTLTGNITGGGTVFPTVHPSSRLRRLHGGNSPASIQKIIFPMRQQESARARRGRRIHTFSRHRRGGRARRVGQTFADMNSFIREAPATTI